MTTEMDQSDIVKLYQSLKPGDRLRYFYQRGNINNRTVHVRGRIDNILIARVWSKRKGWIYNAMSYYSFFYPYVNGHVKIVRSSVFNEEDQSGAPNE